MAKKGSTAKGPLLVKNRVVEDFLIALGVNDDFRERFTKASKDEKAAILAKEFKVGNKTIDALFTGKPGKVTARLRFSDQQGIVERSKKR